MLAQWCLMAWNVAMVRPNCSRTLAYSTAVSTQSVAPPTASAANSARAQASASAAAPTRMSAPDHTVEHHPPGPARQIEAGRCLDRHTVTRPVDQQHVLTRGDQQQVGQTRAEHHTGVTGGDPAGHRNRCRRTRRPR